MPDVVRSLHELPTAELDTRKQGAARANVSLRTFIRFEEQGMPVVTIGARIKRYDPAKYMPWIRGELPPPELPRRGRPKKRATASPTAVVGVARRPEVRPRRRTRKSL
jgi:hypothetical protein